MAKAQVTVKVTPYQLQLIDAALHTYNELWIGVAQNEWEIGELGFPVYAPGKDALDPRRVALQSEELRENLGLK